jgi:hypothetical protein
MTEVPQKEKVREEEDEEGGRRLGELI